MSEIHERFLQQVLQAVSKSEPGIDVKQNLAGEVTLQRDVRSIVLHGDGTKVSVRLLAYHFITGQVVVETLEEARSIFQAWVLDSIRGEDFRIRFPTAKWVDIEGLVESGDVIRARWNGLIAAANQGVPPDKELGPFLKAAISDPVVAQLFPFTSMFWLMFSRCTQYPYSTHGLPYVRPESTDLYEVHRDNDLLGSGDALQALELVRRALPNDIGRAIHGNAKDLGLPH